MAGLLDFLMAQPPQGSPNFSPWGLLGLGAQQPYQPSPETQALQGQLNRAPVNGLLDPNPMTPAPMEPGSLMPQGAALQPSTQGWTGGGPDMPALGASPAGPSPMQSGAPMPPARPLGIDQPQDIRPPQQIAAQANQPLGQLPFAQPQAQQPGSPAAPAKPGQNGFDKFFDVIGGIYGKGGPGDNLIALGAGLASGGGNWGQGLMRGMAMINANQMTAKKREDEQKRNAGQAMLAQEIERRTKGQIPASAALGAIQSGAGAQFLQDAFRKQEQFRPLTDPAERARLGIPAGDKGIYQVDSQGKVSAIGTPQTNINMQSETEFDKKAGGTLAGVYGKMVEAGDTALGRAPDVAILRELSGKIGSQGSTANVKMALAPYARSFGIEINGMSDLEAWDAIIKRMAPQMRATGSGATSDIEYKGFVSSLPQASGSPEGRAMIIETMDANNRYAVAKREIAMKVLSKQMTREQADAAIKALPSPFETFKAWQQSQKQPQGTPGAARILRRLD